MELSDLRIFRAVVRAGGITRAAEQLHRVQSNVTTRIRQLEADLGQELFFRQGKRLLLNPAGERLLEYAERLLELAGEAEAAIRDPEPGGVFRLGAMESAAAIRLPAVLAEYGRRYPQVELQLRTGNPVQLADALLAGEIEAALAAEPVALASFEHLVAFTEETVIITARSYPPFDAGLPLPRTMIVFEKGCPHRRLLEAWYAQRGEAPEQTVELGSYHAMIACVLAGMGAALLPRSVLATFPDCEQLECHSLPPDMRNLKTLCLWRKGSVSPNLRAFTDLLRDGNHRDPAGQRAA